MNNKINDFKSITKLKNRKEFLMTDQMKDDLAHLAILSDCSESEIIRYSLQKTIKETGHDN